MSTGPSDAARTLADWRLGALVERYGDLRWEVSHQIACGVDYEPASQEGTEVYREITSRLGKLRALCVSEMVRHGRTKRVSAAEVLRILDGEGAPPIRPIRSDETIGRPEDIGRACREGWCGHDPRRCTQGRAADMSRNPHVFGEDAGDGFRDCMNDGCHISRAHNPMTDPPGTYSTWVTHRMFEVFPDPECSGTTEEG